VTKRPEAETRKSRKARTAPYQETYDALLRRLIRAREDVGLSQREVSEQMGLAHSFLSKCETGDRRIDIMEFLQLAKLYGKPLQFFLGED
jgi:transcriptional regulator with XRE-family HTH domain